MAQRNGPRGHGKCGHDKLQFSASLHRCIALLKKGNFRYTVMHMLSIMETSGTEHCLEPQTRLDLSYFSSSAMEYPLKNFLPPMNPLPFPYIPPYMARYLDGTWTPPCSPPYPYLLLMSHVSLIAMLCPCAWFSRSSFRLATEEAPACKF